MTLDDIDVIQIVVRQRGVPLHALPAPRDKRASRITLPLPFARRPGSALAGFYTRRAVRCTLSQYSLRLPVIDHRHEMFARPALGARSERDPPIREECGFAARGGAQDFHHGPLDGAAQLEAIAATLALEHSTMTVR
jgi:hypothetical protein